ncbi:MAG: GDSL-type esterase/lipase family protein [Tannerellaceae bacterium]|nr:GDSL-type esterase/lipase family protein [Tannerellaceae bacterium]
MLFILLAGMPGNLFYARGAEVDTLQSRLTFCVDSLVRIADPAHTLTGFTKAMQRLKEEKDTTLTIVHLGDSHIQAGFLTGRVMRLLHAEYGNAGRGWIAPFKLSKTNEPLDYFFHSSAKEWTAGRIVQSVKKAPVGPGGMGIATETANLSFTIGVTPRNGAGHSFNELILYRDARAMPTVVTGRYKEMVDVAYGETPVVPGILRDTFYIGRQVDTLSLKTTRVDPWSNIYYGCILKNGNPGILYHSVGINGVMFVNYTDRSFMERLSLLEPSLLIVSLGTNETFGRRFREEEFAGQVEAFLDLLQEYMPGVPLLLTTPPECYRPVVVNKKKSFVRNEKTELATRAILQITGERGIACWDLFAATGGKNSCEDWFKGKWMGTDRVHFNQDGYAEQGLLLFQAIRRIINEEQ